MVDQHTDAWAGKSIMPDGPQTGPIHQTIVDLVDDEIDIGAFDCPELEETMRISHVTVLMNNPQLSSFSILGNPRPEKPPLPSREETLQYVDNFQNVIAPYVPIVHAPSFKKQVSFQCLWSCSSLSNA